MGVTEAHPCSRRTLPVPVKEVMKVLWRTSTSSRLRGDLRVWVAVLYKCGNITTTVSSAFFSVLCLQQGPSDTLNKLHAAPAKKPFIAKCVRFCDPGEAVLVFLLESHEV
jgi:hypothetical protein